MAPACLSAASCTHISYHSFVRDSSRNRPYLSRTFGLKCAVSSNVTPHASLRQEPCTAKGMSVNRRSTLGIGFLLGVDLFSGVNAAALALSPPPSGPELSKFYSDAQEVANVIEEAVLLDCEGSVASDTDINAFIKVKVLPVLRDYVKNYGDRKGRMVLRAKGFEALPAADAIVDCFAVLKTVAKPPKAGQPLPRLTVEEQAIVFAQLDLIRTAIPSS